MKVSQLIKELKKMPQGAEVGVAHGDNYEYEVAGWVCHVDLHEKSDHAPETLPCDEDRNALASHPEKWVTLHC